MSKRRADWIDEDEYPDDRDVEDFGKSSPVDYDRRTLGRVGNMRQPFWTRTRIFIVVILAILLFSFIFARGRATASVVNYSEVRRKFIIQYQS